MEKKYRIEQQLIDMLKTSPQEQLKICSAYYFPCIGEVEEYLRQDDFDTQIKKLISGDNPLQKRIISPTKQQEFNLLMNECINYELDQPDKFNNTYIIDLIFNLVYPFKSNENTEEVKENIGKNIVGFIQNRIIYCVEHNQDIRNGIVTSLKTKIRYAIGLTPEEFTEIEQSIPQLAHSIENKIKEDKYIKSKINLESKQEKFRTLKNNMLSDPNYLSNLPTINQENIIPNEIFVNRIIQNIMHQSASHPFDIEVNPDRGYIRVNGEILPIHLYNKLLNILEENAKKSFQNINMYLTCNDTIFEDEFYRKYMLHLDDTHILGIEKTTEFINSLIAKRIYENNVDKFNEIEDKLEKKKNDPEALREEYEKLAEEDRQLYLICGKYKKNPNLCERMEERLDKIKNITIPKIDKPKTKEKIFYGPRLQRWNCIFKVYNYLSNLSDEVPTTPKEISKQISKINAIQKNLNKIMSSQKEDNIIERLIYFLVKNSDNPEQSIRNISINVVNEIIDNNMCSLSNAFNKKYKDNPQEIINRILTFDTNRINSIKEKYDEIFEIQNYLDYKYKAISQSVIKNIPYNEWEHYFSSKHENKTGKLDNSSIGPFGIAQLILEEEIKEHKDSLSNGTNITNAIFNLFKVDDKTYYIINFNFVTDIKRIFIVDPKDITKKHHIICEMDAFDETLVAYFDEIKNNGVARFYSVQNTEETIMEAFKDSKFEEIVDFKGKEYTTIMVFSQSSADERITQHYTFAKGKVLSIKTFINDLLNNKIELRTATSLNVLGSFEQDTKKKISDMFKSLITAEKTISKKSMAELSLIGSSNADQMIENMTKSEAEIFIGIKDISNEDLSLIKCVLKQKNLENLLMAINSRIDILRRERQHFKTPMHNVSVTHSSYINDRIEEYDEQINKLTRQSTMLKEIMKINLEVITQKDTNGNNITLNTREDIKTYFLNNKNRFTTEHFVILDYLSERTLSSGDVSFSNEIREYCLELFINKEKTLFETKYQKYYNEYLYRTGAITGQAFKPLSINTVNEEAAVRMFDNEMLNIKECSIGKIAQQIDRIFPNINHSTKIKYLQKYEERLSTIIQIDKSKTKKTKYDEIIASNQSIISEKVEQNICYKKHALRRDVKTISIVSNDLETEKIAQIFTLVKRYIDEVKNMREDFCFEAKPIIETFYFDNDVSEKEKEFKGHEFDIFDTKFSEHCDITFIIVELLNQLRMELTQLYDNYVETGGILYEYETRELENALNYQEKQSVMLQKITSIVRVYTLSIYKLFDYYVTYNSSLSDLKKEATREKIERKMQETKITIERLTNKSSLFSIGTNLLTKLIPNGQPFDQDDQISRIEYANNPTNGFRV